MGRDLIGVLLIAPTGGPVLPVAGGIAALPRVDRTNIGYVVIASIGPAAGGRIVSGVAGGNAPPRLCPIFALLAWMSGPTASGLSYPSCPWKSAPGLW